MLNQQSDRQHPAQQPVERVQQHITDGDAHPCGTYHLPREEDLHPEACVTDDRNSVRRSVQFHLCRRLAPEEVQQDLTRRATEPNSGLDIPDHHPFASSRPYDLESDLAQPSAQIAATSTNVPPQRLIERWRQGVARAESVGPAHVFMVDEELVQAREGADPPHAEEPRRWARPKTRNEPPELCAPGEPHSAPLSEPFERPGKNQAETRNGIPLTQHEMGGQISRGPSGEERRRLRSEFTKKIA